VNPEILSKRATARKREGPSTQLAPPPISGNHDLVNTAAEIEAALPALSVDELRRLHLAVPTALRARTSPPTLTADAAADWWDRLGHPTEAEAEAFAANVEAARQIGNQPPRDPRASS
jgi:hypothetical protein